MSIKYTVNERVNPFGSEGAKTAGTFSASLVKTKKAAFRPGIDLKEMLNSLKFEKA